MGKENIQIREIKETEVRKSENIKFWNDCGVKPLFEKLWNEALEKQNKYGDVMCDFMESEKMESMSLVIDWYNVEGRYSSVSVSRREENKVYFLDRENGEKKEGTKFDMSKSEEKEKLLGKIKSVFSQYLIPPVEE